MKDNKTPKVLLFGPLTPPYNGQAVAFTLISDSFSYEEKIIINTAKYKNSYLNTFYSIFRTLYVFCFYRFSTVYFASSRSFLGFWKDCTLLVLGKWFNKKLINHLHGADFKQFYDHNNLIRPFIKYAYQAVATSIVLIEKMKDEFVDFPEMKIEVVYNCYSNSLNVEGAQYTKKKQLLYLSNLMKSKGIIEFLDASAILLDKYPTLEVKIAGNLLSDKYMKKKEIHSTFTEKYSVLQNRFKERIQYLGSVQGDEKIKLLYESSLFVLPSYYPTEAYPLSIIEAMRTGNAIVTTNHNYLPCIVKPFNGVIVEPCSAKAIIEGVIILLEDKIKLKKIQENNIVEAKQRYSQQRYIQELKSIIEKE